MTKWKKENSRAVDFKSALKEGLKHRAFNLIHSLLGKSSSSILAV